MDNQEYYIEGQKTLEMLSKSVISFALVLIATLVFRNFWVFFLSIALIPPAIFLVLRRKS